jgi:hypothetical protein
MLPATVSLLIGEADDGGICTLARFRFGKMVLDIIHPIWVSSNWQKNH